MIIAHIKCKNCGGVFTEEWPNGKSNFSASTHCNECFLHRMDELHGRKRVETEGFDDSGGKLEEE